MKPSRAKFALLSFLLIFLVACDGLQDIGLDATIVTFTANPSTLKAGEGATLAWTILGGAEDLEVTLTPGDVELSSNGNYQVVPEQTTTYTLSASSEGKTSTKEVMVTVTPREPIDPTPPSNPDPENEPDAACGDGAAKVPFKDVNLQRAVEKALGLSNKGVSCYTITLLENLPAQGTPDAQISDLSGLEFAKNLKIVNLGKNAISDLTVLGKLTNLEQVYLYQNVISDLSPLADLSKLNFLELSYNAISDISALLTLPWAAEDDYVGLKAQSQSIPQEQITALEQLVSEVAYGEEGAPEPEQPEPEEPEPEEPEPEEPEPEQPEPGENDNVYDSFVFISDQEDLDALTGVTKIVGFLNIMTSAEILDFTPLDKLQVVTEGVSIRNSPRLQAIEGFPALVRTGDNEEVKYFTIKDNDKLVTIKGFDVLRDIPELEIIRNPSLQTISGFEKLERIAGTNDTEEPDFSLLLTDLPELESLPSFESLKSLGSKGLKISNTGLPSVAGFNSLTSGKTIEISANPNLSEMTGFGSVSEVAEGVNIVFNPTLIRISGFESLKDGSNSSISGNDSLDCSAAPQANLGFFPLGRSVNNSVDCPTLDSPPDDSYVVTNLRGDKPSEGDESGGNNVAGSLRQVIADAPAGATITFAPELSGETIVLVSVGINLRKDVTIQGDVTVEIDENTIDLTKKSVFSVDDDVVVELKDLTVSRGVGTFLGGDFKGGGITNKGDLVLSGDVTVTENEGVIGGGVTNFGTLTLKDNASITKNESVNEFDAVGGGVANFGTLILKDNASITDNTAQERGGGVFSDERFSETEGTSVTLEDNATISGNTVIAGEGGGVYTSGTLNGADYEGNDVGDDGAYNIFDNEPDQVFMETSED